MGKAWEYARLHYGAESKRATHWVSRLGEDLKAGKIDRVLARLETRETATVQEPEALEG